MIKIVQFHISSQLMEKAGDHRLLPAVADEATWGWNQDFGMDSGPALPAQSERIRSALKSMDPDCSGWSETDITSTYEVFTTTAPESYDGFGTLSCLVNGDGTRTVAIRHEHRAWQLMRYRSGLHRFDKDKAEWD